MSVLLGSEEQYVVTPRYDLPQAIKLGNYDTVVTWLSSQPDTISVPDEEKTGAAIALRLVPCERSMGLDAALDRIEALGLRPGNAAELLAFGAKYPEEQRRFPILALGSTFVDPEGQHRYLYLNRDGCRRIVGLVLSAAGDFPAECRFLAAARIPTE
jgi:hypothetical protein